MDPQVCFSVLALQPKYQQLAKNLAADVAKFSPGIPSLSAPIIPMLFETALTFWLSSSRKKASCTATTTNAL